MFGRGAFPGLLILPLQVESCLKPSAVHLLILLCFWRSQFISRVSDGRLAIGRGWKGAKDTGVRKTFVIVREGDTVDGSEIRLTSW